MPACFWARREKNNEKGKKRKGITGKDRNKRRIDHDTSGAYLLAVMAVYPILRTFWLSLHEMVLTDP